MIPMIISTGAGQEALQMPLMQDDHLIQTRAADAPNAALNLRMLPRTAPGITTSSIPMCWTRC